MPDALKPVAHIILESYIDGMLPVFGIVILKVAHYITGKLMPIGIFKVDTKSEIACPIHQAHN